MSLAQHLLTFRACKERLLTERVEGEDLRDTGDSTGREVRDERESCGLRDAEFRVSPNDAAWRSRSQKTLNKDSRFLCWTVSDMVVGVLRSRKQTRMGREKAEVVCKRDEIRRQAGRNQKSVIALSLLDFGPSSEA